MANHVRPGALAAGVATVLLAAVLYRKETTKCTEFSHLWKDTGPIYLRQQVQNEAFALAGEKLRSVAAAGQTMTPTELSMYLANHFAPDCDWDRPSSDRGKKIKDSFADIARWSKEQFDKETSNG